MRVEDDRSWQQQLLDLILQVALVLFFFLYPLFIHDGYRDILDYKSYLLRWLLGVAVFAAGCVWAAQHKERRKLPGATIAILGLIVSCTLSFWLNGHRKEAIWGDMARRFGYGLVLLILAFYLLLTAGSKAVRDKKILYVLYVSAVLVFVIAICNGWQIDVLQIYEDGWHEGNFISTLGNKNSLAAFGALLLPPAVVWYVRAEQRKQCLIWGLFCFLGNMAMAASGSDSIYLAMAGVWALLLGNVLDRAESVLRYLEILAISLAGCQIMGSLTERITEPKIKWNSLSSYVIFYHPLLWIEAVISIIYLCIIISKKCKGVDTFWLWAQRVYWCLLAVTVVGAILFLIRVNMRETRKSAQEKFGVIGRYLVIDEHWGTNRGSNLRYGVKIYRKSDWLHKIFGYGIGNYYYAIRQVFGEDVSVFGQMMVDAHNECLDWLIQTGAVGLVSFVLFLEEQMKNGLREWHKDPDKEALCLLIVSYVLQGIVNNVHIYTLPVFLGMLVLLGGRKETEVSTNLHR